MAAKAVIEITKEYQDFSRQYREYLSRPEGQEAWFRPEGVTDTRDPDRISRPFATEELAEAARTLFRLADDTTANSGDYALLALQHDAVVSANKAFAERYKSRIRHYTHEAGIQNRVGGEYGRMHYAMDMSAVNLKTRAEGS
jgi:hypothetical protein